MAVPQLMMDDKNLTTDQTNPDRTDVLGVLKRVVTDGESMLDEKSLEVRILSESGISEWDELTVPGPEDLYYLLFSILLQTAIESPPENRKISVFLEEESGVYTAAFHNWNGESSEIRDSYPDRYELGDTNQNTGLSPYSARLIIESLGGEMRWESAEDDGNLGRVTLPRD